MADENETPGTPRSSGNGGAGAGGAGGGNQGSGGSQRKRNRNRNRNRKRNRPAGASTTGAGAGGPRTSQAKKGQGAGQRSSQGGAGSGGASRSAARPRGGQGQPRAAVALEPPPPLEPIDVVPSLGAPQIFPAEVAANRRRAMLLCAWTAVVPAVLLGVLLWVAVSPLAALVAFVVAGAAVTYGVWRLAPAMALRTIGAAPADDPRLFDVTEGLCATFGLSMPSLHVVDDDVPNACALGRDARRADLVVTTGLLRRVDPIELEGVIAHELAHVKRGDNGVSCVGITLATLFGGETTLRRCVGRGREYRADVVGAFAVRYPRGLLGALCTMTEAPAPDESSLFASPARFGRTRWVWIDPSVGHRDEPPEPGDLDATSVRAAALSEW